MSASVGGGYFFIIDRGHPTATLNPISYWILKNNIWSYYFDLHRYRPFSIDPKWIAEKRHLDFLIVLFKVPIIILYSET